MSNNLVLGRGKVYFDRFLPGTETKTGERYLGSTAAFSVSAETQELEHYSSEAGLRVKDESVTLQVDYTGAMTVENINQDNVALFFFGTAETATIAADTGVTEDFTAEVDRFYQLGMTASKPEGIENVESVAVVRNPDTDNETLTLDTDYTLDAQGGYVGIMEGGAVVDGDTIRVTYNVPAQTQERVISGTDLIQGAVRFRSANGVGGQRNFYLPKVTLRPNGEFALKGEEWQQFSFNLEILQAGNLANVFATGRGVV